MPFTRHHFQHQAMLRIKGDMIPVFPSTLVLQAGWVAPFFFLVNKGPFLVKLDLLSQGGKATPPRHECVPQDRPPADSDDTP
jgi:hypothetical protein